MGTTAQKLEYLGTTKSQLKDMINYGLDDDNKITSSTTFRNYVTSIFKAFLESLNNPSTLFNNLPKITGTGSNITLNDTANAPMRIMLNATDITQDGTPTPSSPQEIHTISGDNKLVVNGNNIFNGYAKVNSTFTNSIATALQHFKDTGEYAVGYPDTPANNKLLSSQLYMTAFIPVHEGITYTAVPHLPRTANYNFAQIFFLDDNGNIISYSPRWTEVAYTHTVASNEKYMLLSMRIDETYPINTTAEVVIGATAPTSYEPYISQTAEVNLKSKNLFDGTNIIGGYRLDVNGANYGELGYYISSFIKVEPNTTYTKNSPTIDGYHRIAFYTNNNVSTFISKIDDANTITTPATCNYVRFCGKDEEIITTQFEKSSTMTDYVPYYDYGDYSKINTYKDQFIRTSGKQLFDSANANVLNLYINTNGEILTASNGKSIYIECEPSTTYTISRTAGARFRITDTSVIPANGVTGSQFVGTDTASKLVITTSANAKYLVVNYYTGNSDTLSEQAIRDSIMIQKGNIENPQYEPYGSNEWYKGNRPLKIVFNGSENWSLGNTNTRRTSYYTEIADKENYITSSSTPNLLSNYFRSVSENSTWTTGDMSCETSYPKRIILCMNSTEFTTLSDFTTWLSTHNVELWYVSSTPTYTKITGTLAEQLEYVYQLLKSYKGVTNISQVNNDLAFELDVEAVEDME